MVRRHGTGLYVSDGLRHVPVEVGLPNVVAVHLLDLNVYVVSVYRPPSYSSQENNELLDFMRNFSIGRELVVLGDFNLPTLSWPVSGVYVRPVDREFNECFVECGFHQWVEEGTYTSSGNTLDLVLTSEEDRVLDVQVLDPLPGCDHCPVLCDVIFQFGEEWSSCRSRESRLWSRGRYNEIAASLQEMEWVLAFEGLSVVETNSYNVSG